MSKRPGKRTRPKKFKGNSDPHRNLYADAKTYCCICGGNMKILREDGVTPRCQNCGFEEKVPKRK